MGKKKKMKLYPQRFSKKFASHPYMKAQAQETPLVEEVIPVVEAPVEPVVPVVEAAVEAPKPKRTRRTRKNSTAPKRKTGKPKAKEEE